MDTQQSPDTDMDTSSDTDSESVVNVQPTGQAEEGEVSDLDQDISLTDTGQTSTKEQHYRETMRGVSSYMCWIHILDIDANTSSADDNPFAAPKQQPVGKVGVNLSTDDWLCREMDGLNLTLTQGYPSRSSETGGLQRDQFVKHSKSHAKWYWLHPNKDRLAGSVSFWHCYSAKLNSAYSWIARSCGLTSPAPTSRTLSHETLRRWEKAARESTYVCNQAAGLRRASVSDELQQQYHTV